MKKKLKKYYFILPFLVIVLIIVLYLIKTNNPEETSIFPPCFIYEFTGIKCAGCGMTRSVHYFLNFNFKKAVLFNPLLFIFIIFFVYYIIKISIYQLKKKAISKNSFTVSLYILLIITVIYMVIRNFINI